MLVLTCDLNKAIRLNDDIRITVQSIDRGEVKLQISTPRSVPIFRREIYLKIKEGTNRKR
ncbi:carbon storage regulator [Pseudomonas sp. SWRI79]|uniref:Carbon storage regulator n=1 Tax=Pseudomonas farris TaxID=2841207 RepID=A0ABS6PZF0_9PSED|nr:carbon storage regulator [Pseudomonas farris]